MLLVYLEMSQFHYGSITTTVLVKVKRLTEESLNSTMVRLQLVSEKEFLNDFEMSQFHYGSITTWRQWLIKQKKSYVSIPLWFDYNKHCTVFI